MLAVCIRAPLDPISFIHQSLFSPWLESVSFVSVLFFAFPPSVHSQHAFRFLSFKLVVTNSCIGLSAAIGRCGVYRLPTLTPTVTYPKATNRNHTALLILTIHAIFHVFAQNSPLSLPELGVNQSKEKQSKRIF